MSLWKTPVDHHKKVALKKIKSKDRRRKWLLWSVNDSNVLKLIAIKVQKYET
jgi:hypothetical protein